MPKPIFTRVDSGLVGYDENFVLVACSKPSPRVGGGLAGDHPLSAALAKSGPRP
jgi:hypothetical protein